MNISVPVNSHNFPPSLLYFLSSPNIFPSKAEILNVYLLMGRNFQKAKYYVKYCMGYHKTTTALPLIPTLLSICLFVQSEAWLPLAIWSTVLTGVSTQQFGAAASLLHIMSEKALHSFHLQKQLHKYPLWRMGEGHLCTDSYLALICYPLWIQHPLFI